MVGMKRSPENYGTRGKGKKSRSGDGESSQDIHRRIGSSHSISGEDQMHLFHLHLAVCYGCRVNTKDNPNCFCALVPPPNSTRKQGLWQKIPEAVVDLGIDPAEDLRLSADPIGLANLGATCYVNSVLQCLYMTPVFKNGVFLIEHPLLLANSVLFQLAKLFAELQMGKKRFVDPTDFVRTLQLDSGVQQDGQEFMKLLLSLLETVLDQSTNPALRNLVQDLFRGTFSYVTRCSKCGRESESSSQLVAFYELEVNVKGFSALLESLDDYLSEEKLEGENQYSCEYCKERTDATRAVKLRSLPPVLNFQLKRFVFNPKTSTKKKVTSRFSFPLSLDLGSLVTGVTESRERGENFEGLYDLTAILVHKGNMASSGHYVAHIKDEKTGQWWQFDDENVTGLGNYPLGNGFSGNRSAPAGPENGSVTAEGDTEVDEEVDMGNSEAKFCEPDEGKCSHSSRQGKDLVNGKVDPQLLTSADAYMLMYTQRRSLENKDTVFTEDLRQTVDLKNKDGDNNTLSSQLLPDYLARDVREKNAKFEASCQQYQKMKELEKERVTGRREEVREVLAKAPIRDKNQPAYWISSQWLRAWADNSKPPGDIDNTGLLCEHDKFPPRSVPLAKLISEWSWKQLYKQYGGGPLLSLESRCRDCIYNDVSTALSADHFRDERFSIKKQVEANLSGNFLDDKTYFVSKSWINMWIRRKNAESVSSSDSGPTSSILCPHGGLLPEQASGAKRQLVDGYIWAYFKRTAEEVDGSDPQDRKEFCNGTDECPVCEVDLMSEASKQEGLKATKLEQKQRHDALFQGKSTPLKPREEYFLVPRHWLNSWRTYLTVTSGKNMNKASPPFSLQDAIIASCCTEHDGLLWNPPELVYKRMDFVQRSIQDDYFTVVSRVDWEGLCEEWGQKLETKCLVAHLLAFAANCSYCFINQEDKNNNSNGVFTTESGSVSTNIGEDTINRGDTGAPTRVPLLITHPEVCRHCMAKREFDELANRLDYTDGEIVVELMKGKEPPRSVVAQEAERRSTRLRKQTSVAGGRVVLKVSGETTVYTLKMQIWEALNVTRENQRLGCGEMELGDDNAHLAGLNILPGYHLWVVDTEEHEHRDIADDFATFEQVNTNTEKGFIGTGLVGGGLASTSKTKETHHNNGRDGCDEATNLEREETNPWEEHPEEVDAREYEEREGERNDNEEKEMEEDMVEERRGNRDGDGDDREEGDVDNRRAVCRLETRMDMCVEQFHATESVNRTEKQNQQSQSLALELQLHNDEDEDDHADFELPDCLIKR